MQHQIGHEIDRQIDKLDDTNKTIDETNKVILKTTKEPPK